ncbi:MAG TPA: DMT family transporter [Streptosporangiaceae bacterium]|nr:DMT family transporter [Streptosporangiaceae bacterium]
MFPVTAVVTALASSLMLGASAVIEQRGTKRVAIRPTLSPRLFVDLAHERLWLTGIATNVAGFALQVVALRFGELALVEPILVCDLIFAVLLSAALRRKWDPVMLAGVLACAAGVAGFLAIARPSGGTGDVSFTAVIPLVVGLAATLAVCLAVARANSDARPIALALGCGISYGVAAFLVKLVTSEFSGGLPAVLGHWPIYALAIIGPVGFLLNQNAFQQGTLIAPVLAIITVCDPIVSIGLAYVFLNEKLARTPAAIAGEVICLLVMTIGIVVIAHHSPIATRRLEQAAAT